MSPSQCNLRTFTFIIVLELAVFESQVEAFTIHRTTELTPDSDLKEAESARLEVRNDLIRDVKPIEVKNDSPLLTVPIETTAKTEEIQKNEIPLMNLINDVPYKNNTTFLPVESSDTNSSDVTANPTLTTVSTSHQNGVSIQEIETTTPLATVFAPSINNSSKLNESTATEVLKNNSISEDEPDLENKYNLDNNVDTKGYDNIPPVKSNEVTVNSLRLVNMTDLINATYPEVSNDTSLIGTNSKLDNTTRSEEPKRDTSEVEWKVLNTSEVKWIPENSNTTNNWNATIQTNETTIVDLSTKNGTESMSYNMTIAKDELSPVTLSPSLLDKNTTGTIVSQGNDSTEKLAGDSSGVNGIPFWKKYTTIDRKRVNSTKENTIEDSTGEYSITDNTTTEDNTTWHNTTGDSTTGDNTRIVNSTEDIRITVNITKDISRTVNSAEDNTTEVDSTENKATSDKMAGSNLTESNTTEYNVTSITENEDLLQSESSQTQTSISLDTALNTYSDIPSLERLKNELLASNKIISTTEIAHTIRTSTENGLLEDTGTSTELTILTANAISSKRAGFLDFSVRPTNSTNIQKDINISLEPGNHSRASLVKTTPKSPTALSSMTSQSQLVEDALNEELMKEEVLSDNVANAVRSREDRFETNTQEPKPVQPTPVDLSHEDKLRVKPISSDKIKNVSLYTVNPNYKPLKKIAVQPPKPFVRDPDDNSWRNESLSSLGIVFKANNSSKPFTQVLKNKTEIEWNALEKSKTDELELRDRLEKIAEIRKSKKKKINQFGETIYTDYEEAVSGESLTNSTQPTFLWPLKVAENDSLFKNDFTTQTNPPKKELMSTPVSTKFNDEYDEEDESEYTLPNIDLKKYFTPTVAAPPVPSISLETDATRAETPMTHNFSPDRRPTVQYFPPRSKQPNVVFNDYDSTFQNKINAYTYDTTVKVTNTEPVTPATEVASPKIKNKYESSSRPSDITRRPPQLNRNVYLTNPTQDQRNVNIIPIQTQDQSGYNQAAYVIKNLRDFIDGIVQADETETEGPFQGVTVNSVGKKKKPKPPADYYDYETQFRKDVLNRFAENFNQNSERFNADFPLLYNTSVMHSVGHDGNGGAESSAFMRRLYDDILRFKYGMEPPPSPLREPNCDRAVELSPAYELHYYVPEEEEKAEVEKPVLVSKPPYRFRL